MRMLGGIPQQTKMETSDKETALSKIETQNGENEEASPSKNNEQKRMREKIKHCEHG